MSYHTDDLEFLELLDEIDPVWPRTDEDED